MRHNNLAQVLRNAGLSVIEVGGWQARGNSMGDIRAVILHHTAGPASGNLPSLGVVRDGRAGLPGPLAQLMVARDGAWYVVASGLANHAGLGSAPGLPTNNANMYTLGVEAESTGFGDWTSAQKVSYPRGVAALLNAFNLPAAKAIAHKEWAPSRKIDPAGWPGDMTGFRTSVQQWMNNNFTDGGLFMALADWQQERILNRVLSLSQGVAGENHDGEQFKREQAERDEMKAKLVVLETKLDALADKVAGLQVGGGSVDLAAIAKAVADELHKRTEA